MNALVPLQRVLYHLVIAQAPGVRARAFLNDVPAYEDPPTPNHQSTTTQVNNLLVPGRNELRIEVTEQGDPSTNMFWAEIYRDPDASEKPVRHATLKWPDAVAELPAPLPRPLPFVWQREVIVEDDHPKPLYADVPPEQFPPEGTDELRAAVKEFHDALAGRDARKLTDLTWFEAEDSARYYPARPPPSRSEIQSTYAASFEEPWTVPRWEPDRLLFTPRAGGRLVHVTAVDDEHAIRGAAAARPEAQFLLNPLLVRHQGRWQLYR